MTTVIWIDWYSYHVSRFRALFQHAGLRQQVSGIELVGGCGVHPGLRFRDGERRGLPVTSLFPQTNWSETGQLKLAWAVWKKLNQLRPAAVLVPGWYTAPALAAALWAKLHRKLSILMSETTEFDHRRVWWKEAFKRLLVKLLFDAGIAGGKPHLRYLEQLGLPLERLAKCYDVVDNDFYAEESERVRRSPGARKRHGLPESYFLYVGRLASEKNVARCLQAFAQYRHRGGTWSFVVVGDGPLRAELEELSRQLGVHEHVIFAGLKTSRETTTYFALANCFVLPSTREPWGLVVNEAMASGLPVLVSNRCGCAEDLVEAGGNGYLFDPTGETELAECLLKMNRLAPAERIAMRRRSQQLIANFSLDHWAAEVARLVQTAA